jgi:hypothetical protein
MSPQRLVRLYPATWRDRYGDEFLAMLEDRPPTGVAILDVVWGALDAHLFPQAPEGRFRMFTRFAGLAALGAGLLLVLGVFNIGFGSPEVNAARVAVIYALWFVGLVGIHVRQATAQPAMAWFGFLAALAALIAGVAGFILSSADVLPPTGGEYGFVSGLALWIGSVVLGATMLAIRVFPSFVGLLLTVSAPIAMLGLVVARAESSADAMGIVSLAGIALYGLAWMGIGISLLSAQPREGVLGPTAAGGQA